MTFLVQFRRLRRGVPEVIRTMHLATVDGAAALAYAQGLIGTRHWPVRTDALRVMDEGGRTLIDWTVPAAMAQPSGHSLGAVPTAPTDAEPRPAPPVAAQRHPLKPQRSETSRHLFAVGQPVSYAEDGRLDICKVAMRSSGSISYAIRRGPVVRPDRARTRTPRGLGRPRTWPLRPVVIHWRVDHYPLTRQQISSRSCTQEGKRDMAQNILNLAKAMVRRAWAAWTLAPAPPMPQRPQLDGRRGYGDGNIKQPD